MEDEQLGTFRRPFEVENFVRRASSCFPKVRRVGGWVGWSDWFGRTVAMRHVLHSKTTDGRWWGGVGWGDWFDRMVAMGHVTVLHNNSQ